jgi:hypothetical protein
METLASQECRYPAIPVVGGSKFDRYLGIYLLAKSLYNNNKMKTNNKSRLARAAAIALVLSFFSSFQTTADASCRITDLENGYYLACLGDKGTCKFIPPEGDPYYCSGNHGEAMAILPDLEDIHP